MNATPRIALAVLVGAMTVVQAGTQGSPRWEDIGPAPPPIGPSIAADPVSRTIYVGTTGTVGILKSTDDGAHFKSVNSNLQWLDVGAMAMAQGNPDIVYVGGGDGVISSTLDGGATWQATGDSSGQGVVALAIDPTNPDIVYAGSAPGGGIWKTTDGGASWASASEGMGGEPAIFSISIDPRNPNVLYAGTTGLGAFKSLDGALSWTALNIDSTVQAVLVDPRRSAVVYAGSNGNGVYRSSDGGLSFRRAGSPEVGVILSLAKSGQRLYAGTAGGGVSVSIDEGAHWQSTGISSGLALSLATDSYGAVYLGTNLDGALILPDAQRNAGGDRFRATAWRRLAWGQIQRCACQSTEGLSIDPADPQHVFASTNLGGLLISDDGGRSWYDGSTHGLTSHSPRGIAFDPQDSRRVYAASFTGGGVFRSADGGRHWSRRLFGSSLVYSTSIAVDPVDHSVYVATLSGDGVWKSTDYGNSFQRIDRAPGAAAGEYLNLTGRGITVDPHRHNIVYAASSRRNPGIWRSLDAGRSWLQVDAAAAFSVTVDPANSDVVYAGSRDFGVLKSVDGGANFIVSSQGLVDGTSLSFSAGVQVNPVNRNILYVATSDGVFESTNGAGSWFAINRGLADVGVNGFAVDQQDGATMYAAPTFSIFKADSARH